MKKNRQGRNWAIKSGKVERILNKDLEIADKLNEILASVFTIKDKGLISVLTSGDILGIFDRLHGLSTGGSPDGIPPRILNYNIKLLISKYQVIVLCSFAIILFLEQDTFIGKLDSRYFRSKQPEKTRVFSNKLGIQLLYMVKVQILES